MRAAAQGARSRPAETSARAALLFRAFSDQTRLRILHTLRPGEICVADLVEILRVPQARASRHLAYLRRAGLVQSRRSGLWIFYSLAPARGKLHASLLGCLGACVQELPEFASDSLRYRKIRAAGGCCPR